MIPLPEVFLTGPLAHRALHGAGKPENSLAAAAAAVEAGYGIEIDIQASSDGQPMVFHDYDLGRLTGVTGAIRLRSAAELKEIVLLGGTEGIPTLSEFLQLVRGQIPILIEIKDQDGALGADVGPVGMAIAETLRNYTGPVAVMSFNPHAVDEMASLLPDLPRGLTTCHFPAAEWPTVPEARRAELRSMPDLDRVGASFISHQASDLGSAEVATAKARGLPVLCWTIRSEQAEREARKVADNVTFEGYLP